MIIGVIALAPLASEILDFWFVPRAGEAGVNEATPRGRVTRDVWFRKDDAFDAEIRARFGAALAAGIAGAFGDWCTTPAGCLARVVLLDQFTRNAFRGTPRCLRRRRRRARDGRRCRRARLRPIARTPASASSCTCRSSTANCLRSRITPSRSSQRSPRKPASTNRSRGRERHRDVIRRFGRFPHRNEILGRASTPEEIAFLEQPGSRF